MTNIVYFYLSCVARKSVFEFFSHGNAQTGLLRYRDQIVLKFSNCVFAITFKLMIMNGQTCKLFENIINDVQNKGNGEKNTA